MNRGYGIIELMIGFLILSVLVAMGLHMTMNQMRTYKDNQAVDPIGVEVEQVIKQVEKAKNIKQQQEQNAIENWLQ